MRLQWFPGLFGWTPSIYIGCLRLSPRNPLSSVLRTEGLESSGHLHCGKFACCHFSIIASIFLPHRDALFVLWRLLLGIPCSALPISIWCIFSVSCLYCLANVECTKLYMLYDIFTIVSLIPYRPWLYWNREVPWAGFKIFQSFVI